MSIHCKGIWNSIALNHQFTECHNTVLDVTKLKAFANNKLKITLMFGLAFDRAENIMGKGENAGYQHFLLFP